MQVPLRAWKLSDLLTSPRQLLLHTAWTSEPRTEDHGFDFGGGTLDVTIMDLVTECFR